MCITRALSYGWWNMNYSQPCVSIRNCWACCFFGGPFPSLMKFQSSIVQINTQPKDKGERHTWPNRPQRLSLCLLLLSDIFPLASFNFHPVSPTQWKHWFQFRFLPALCPDRCLQEAGWCHCRTSLISLLSGITILYCLLSNIWQQWCHILCPIF